MLFDRDLAISDQISPVYDVSPDGQLFYLVQQDSKTQQKAGINLVLKWPEELKRLVPAGKKQ